MVQVVGIDTSVITPVVGPQTTPGEAFPTAPKPVRGWEQVPIAAPDTASRHIPLITQVPPESAPEAARLPGVNQMIQDLRAVKSSSTPPETNTPVPGETPPPAAQADQALPIPPSELPPAPIQLATTGVSFQKPDASQIIEDTSLQMKINMAVLMSILCLIVAAGAGMMLYHEMWSSGMASEGPFELPIPGISSP